MVVYPRWRGELDRTASVVSSGSGLSPLARGALREEYLQHPQERFIPAGAGNTEVVPFLMTINAVYPRWRGEHLCTINGFNKTAGLSPLARGTHVAIIEPGLQPRFIPAGAGNTV